MGALVEWLQEHVTFDQESTNNLAVLHNQNNIVRLWYECVGLTVSEAGHLPECDFMCRDDCIHGCRSADQD